MFVYRKVLGFLEIKNPGYSVQPFKTRFTGWLDGEQA